MPVSWKKILSPMMATMPKPTIAHGQGAAINANNIGVAIDQLTRLAQPA